MPDVSESPPDAMSREDLLAEVQRLRWLVDAQPQVPWEADAEGDITDFSQRWLELTGLTREEALGGGWARVQHPDDLPAMAEAWSRSVATGEPYDVEHRIRLADGSYRWMRSRATARRGANGEVLAWYGTTEDVQPRKASEADLRRTQESLGLAMRGSRMGWWRRDLLTGLVVWSPELEEIFGLAAGSFDGTRQSFVDFVHPEDRERLNATVARAIATGEDYSVEFRFTRADGSEGWMEGRGKAFFDDAGRPVVSYGIGVDVTERREAEHALRMAGETFESLVRNSPFGVYVVDADFRLALVSQGAQKVFASVRPLVGRDFGEVMRVLWEEPFASEAIGVFRRVLETGEPFHSPRMVETRSDVGEVESYDWRAERIAMPDGRLAAVCHFYDLSERLGYETSLNERDERFAAAIGAIGVLWTNDPDGRMMGEQPGWAALTGQTREEYEGYGWAEAVHPEDAQPTIDAWNEAVRERRTFQFEHRVRRSDGEWRRFSIRAVPVLDGRGQAREWVGVHADVTELRGAIDALRRSEADLERKVAERTADLQASNEALSGFMYHVAHDLRAPLRSIASTSRIVMEDFGDALPEEAVGQLVRQAKAATRMGALIDDLLRLARLSQQMVERAPIDLTRPAREVAEESLAAHPGTSVRVRVEEGLDAWADPRLLRLALGNLVENAVKYSPEGGTVLVGKHAEGTYFVSDEGIGIDPAYFGKIFEPFQRLHADEEFSGTGIGLSNVRQAMERHGGKIWVESELDKGSTFLFTLG